jgi:hypothetical protein
MSTYCRVCGKPMEEGQGDICEVCQEGIRAEAMGRQRRIAKDAPRGEGKLRVRPGQGVKDKKSLPQPHDEEGEKKPHHFKSMAEYLEYLKGKE